MSLLLQSLKLRLWLFLVILAVIFSPISGSAQMPDLVLDVGDTGAYSGQQDVIVPIYMSNYFDSVVAFQLWLQLDRPDIAVFSLDSATVIDTTFWDCLAWDSGVCVESVLTTPEGEWDFFHVDTNEVLRGGIDAVGTLCSGWEYVDGRSLSGMGFDLNTVGIADMPAPPTTPGIPPQQGGILINLLIDIFDIPDTMTDRTVNIVIGAQCLYNPNGECIGEVWTDSVLDTTCYVCTVWADSVCLNWEEVWPPPPEGCDSMVIEWEYFLDTTGVIIFNGSITVEAPPPICGDVNGDRLGPNVADLTYLVDYLFLDGPPPPIMDAANVDGTGVVNVADLAYLVSYLFYDGPPPACW
jgi:hypothetical protein